MQAEVPKKKEFIIAYMVDEVRVGQRFTMWPLHMTLLPWFEAPGGKAVKEELNEALDGFGKIYTKTIGKEKLGPRKQPATLLEKTDMLDKLHKKVLIVINKNDWPLKGRWTGELYMPHVTQKMGKDAEGEIVIDKLVIVESQAQGYREVVAEVKL